jgi:hypothetical protein
LLRFCHAENIIPLIASLNIFKDAEALKADNYESQTGRLFKTSTIAPFSSNLAFVLFKCFDGSRKVQTLLNELPIGVINSGRLPCSVGDERFGRLKDSICDPNDLVDLVRKQTKCHHEICVDEEKVEL